VRGTEDLELAYEIMQPDGSTDFFPVALRRSIGLVRLSGDDRNDRDLRLVQGSALDRLLSDKGLRSRMASELANSDVKVELTDAAAFDLIDDGDRCLALVLLRNRERREPPRSCAPACQRQPDAVPF
jgi:putative ATP-dependent endonuclease of the OLD family